jgi:hypothetical protein
MVFTFGVDPGLCENSETLHDMGTVSGHAWWPAYVHIPDGIADAKDLFASSGFMPQNIKSIRTNRHNRHLGASYLLPWQRMMINQMRNQDPIDRVSSRIQAAACTSPSNFLHWGNLSGPKNKYVLDEADVYAAFEFKNGPGHKISGS